MKIFDLLKIISSCFNKLNIPYLVTGSVASMAYGEARFTNDIDVVAEIKNEHIPEILKFFPGRCMESNSRPTAIDHAAVRGIYLKLELSAVGFYTVYNFK